MRTFLKYEVRQNLQHVIFVELIQNGHFSTGSNQFSGNGCKSAVVARPSEPFG